MYVAVETGGGHRHGRRWEVVIVAVGHRWRRHGRSAAASVHSGHHRRCADRLFVSLWLANVIKVPVVTRRFCQLITIHVNSHSSINNLGSHRNVTQSSRTQTQAASTSPSIALWCCPFKFNRPANFVISRPMNRSVQFTFFSPQFINRNSQLNQFWKSWNRVSLTEMGWKNAVCLSWTSR